MRPAGSLAELAAAIGARGVEGVKTGIGIRLEDAAATMQVPLRMLPLPVLGEAVNDAGWCGPGPRPLIRDIGPDPALLDAFAEAAIPA